MRAVDVALTFEWMNEYLYFLEPCVQAFQRHRVRWDVLDALLIFSQLALQSPLIVLISGDF